MTVVFMSQVTLSKEGSSGDYSLEAGALVLGDQGRFITVQLFLSSLKFSFPSTATTTFLLFFLHHLHH